MQLFVCDYCDVYLYNFEARKVFSNRFFFVKGILNADVVEHYAIVQLFTLAHNRNPNPVFKNMIMIMRKIMIKKKAYNCHSERKHLLL